MSTFHHIVLQRSTLDLLPSGGRSAGRHRRYIRRGAAIVCGFAGAVAVLAAILSLVARLALNLDAASLPGTAASALCLGLGVLAMTASKSLADEDRVAD